MKNDVLNELMAYIDKANLDTQIKGCFIERIHEGRLTRDENPHSHICIYFAAYDGKNKKVFIGKHIKSGLWLFNGGHLDKDESIESGLYREMGEEWGTIKKINIHSPSLFTITPIENPQKQICKIHFDIWFFIPFSSNGFSPDTARLSTEFFEWGWKTIPEASLLVKDKATKSGLKKAEELFF